MATRAARAQEAALSRGEVEIVDDDQEVVLRRDFVETNRFRYRLSREIHVGVGLEKQAPLRADGRLDGEGLEAGLGKLALGKGSVEALNNHEPGVVPRLGVLRSGVAKADDELHGWWRGKDGVSELVKRRREL